MKRIHRIQIPGHPRMFLRSRRCAEHFREELDVLLRNVSGTQILDSRLKRAGMTFMLLMFFSNSQAFACPFCKEAIAKMGQVWTSIGFNLSIFFMIAVPFLLVGSFALVLFLNYRKYRKS